MNRVLAFALVVSMAGASSVFAAGKAQLPANSSIAGTAKQSSGATIPNATVQLRDMETGQLVGTTTSDAAGQFAFQGLNAGSFTVEVVSAAGEILGQSALISVTEGAAINGVVVSTMGGASHKKGAFLTSTAGIVTMVAVAGGVTGVAVATRPNQSGSK
jgi:Carboxypeptidase regulatory-like domain